MLSLDMSMVMKGQIWRLVTWVIYPPSSVGGMSNLLMFVLAIAFFYYPIVPLWNVPGELSDILCIFFRDFLFTVIAAALLYAVTGGYVTVGGMMLPYGSIFTTYYISLSIFLAYAVTYPDLQLLLMFVIPIKMKWMAFVYGLFIAWDIVSYLRVGLWVGVVPIVASLFEIFVIFLFSVRGI